MQKIVAKQADRVGVPAENDLHKLDCKKFVHFYASKASDGYLNK